MKTARRKRSSRRARRDEAQELYERARRLPGVSEVIELYDRCREADSAARLVTEAMAPKVIIYGSTSSA